MSQYGAHKRRWFSYALGLCLLCFAIALAVYLTTPRTSAVIPAVTATQVMSIPTSAFTTPPFLPSATPSLTGLPALLTDVPKLRSLHIIDEWYGMSELMTYSMDYSLQLAGGDIRGQGTFSVGYTVLVSETFDVVIPSAKVQEFLRTLTTTTGAERTYEYHGWTDDYPHLELILDTDAESITFFTDSQDRETRAPWGVRAGGREFFVQSAVPMQAYKLLLPYLSQEKLKLLEDKFLSPEALNTRSAIYEQTQKALSATATAFAGTAKPKR